MELIFVTAFVVLFCASLCGVLSAIEDVYNINFGGLNEYKVLFYGLILSSPAIIDIALKLYSLKMN